MKKYAVITGDITNFTSLSDARRQDLISGTNSLLRKWVSQPQNAAFFRGDSYQILFEEPDLAVTRSIQLICWFKKQGKLSTRISIGIGDLAYRGKTVLESDGEAFHLSGRNFDELGPKELIRLTTTDDKKNELLGILLMFMNLVINDWTPNQAEVIFELLNDQTATQEQIAKKLQIFQSGIARRLKIAHWKEIEKALGYLSEQLK